MNQKNHLKFSADGKEVSIVFKDGKESAYFGSKKELFEALELLTKTQRITEPESNTMFQEAYVAKNLPFSTEEEQPCKGSGIGALMSLLVFGSLFGGLGLRGSDLLDLLEDNEEDHPVEVPLFKMCSCGKHGKILSKKAMATPLVSKEEARHAADMMEKKSYITAEEKTVILTQIDASSLPEERSKKTEAEKVAAN